MKNYKSLIIKSIKQGFLFFAFSTLLIALQFGLYITDSSILELMDLEGWLFFITSCISHAAMFALIPYLLSLIFTFCRCTKTARVVQIVGVVLLCIINYLNSQVYAIYHFHINGFVLSMVFGEGAGEIFNFDIMLYLKEIALFLVWQLSLSVYGMPLIFYGRNARRHTPGPSQDASSAAPSLPISAISMEPSISSLP